MWRKSPVPFLRGERPLVMAHRGDSANTPENSLLAYTDAYNLKVDVIEADLRITQDKEIVFFHDARVDRTTNGRGTVKSLTLRELKKLDQGYRFKGVGELAGTYPYRGKGLEIQSLEEVLTRFPDIKFNMDMKDRLSHVPGVLARKIKELNAEDRVMVGSFHHKQLEAFRLQSGAPTSASPREVWRFRKQIFRWYKKNRPIKLSEEITLEQEEVLGEPLPYFALQIPEKFFGLRTFFGAEFFKLCHMVEIAVHVWTVNDPGDMFRLLDWGVDGLFSDNPKMLLDIVNFKFGKK